MKKICVLKYSFHDIGGTEHVAVKLSNELSKTFEVHLISILSSENINFFKLTNDVRYQSFFDGRPKVRESIIKGSKELRKYLIENDIDVLIGVGVITFAFLKVSTLGLRVKTVACDHTALANNYGNKSYELQRWIGAQFSDKIIVLTQENMEEYVRKYKISRNKISYIYNWIDDVDQKTGYQKNYHKKIITVGRLAHVKGYDYLMTVAKAVLTKHPEWSWDICGAGEDEIKKSLKLFIEENHFEGRLNILGNVKEMSRIYETSDLYVMTSRYEGLPLVLLEAKQHHLPIVSFACPTGPSEIIRDGENGYLVDCFDTDQMIEKISQLVENSELRKEFSKKSYLDIEKFSKERIVKQWCKLIEGL